MNKLLNSVAVAAGLLASTAAAEGEFYYGLSVGLSTLESSSLGGNASVTGNDFSIGGVAGYEWPLAGGTSFVIEGTLDLLTGKTLTYSSPAQDACTNRSPDWCEVDMIARLRGVYSSPLNNGMDVHSMVGIAYAQGRAEDGPDNYPDSSATGYTLGAGVSRDMNGSELRFEFTYDRLENVSPDDFSKTLEILSLRTTFMF